MLRGRFFFPTPTIVRKDINPITSHRNKIKPNLKIRATRRIKIKVRVLLVNRSPCRDSTIITTGESVIVAKEIKGNKSLVLDNTRSTPVTRPDRKYLLL